MRTQTSSRSIARRAFVVAAALFISGHAVGATIYVDGQLTSTSSTTYNPQTRTVGTGTAIAYRTVAGASAVATAGTIVEIRAGTYNEQLRPSGSGTSAAPVTFKNYGNEQVFLVATPGINISDRSYIVLDGLRVENVTWMEAKNSHYNIVRNCAFKKNPNSGTTGNVRFIQSNYNKILNNVIEDGNDNLLLIDSNYNLVQGNTITEARHSIFGIRCGDYNIIRGNYFSNTQQKIGEVYDCGVDTTAVPNSFNSTTHNVIEDNIFALTEPYYSTSGGNGIQYAGQDGIVRRNVFYDCNVGVAMQVYGDEAQNNRNNRIYSNVFFSNNGAGVVVRPGVVDVQFKNNIMLANEGCCTDCLVVSPGQVAYRKPIASTMRFENNSIFYTAAGQPVIEEEFASAGLSISAFSAANPGLMIGNLELDPKFVDATAHNFQLRADSPMIDAGTFLTRTTSAGSGTTMTVADAKSFFNGFGISGETGDLVQLQGQTATARVVAVDHTTGVLTLDRSLTWTANQGVALAFSGGAPDIGAFEVQSTPGVAPSAPTNLRVVSQ